MAGKTSYLTFTLVKKACASTTELTDAQRNMVLLYLADAIEANIPKILHENEKDLATLSPNDPKYDRLLLSSQRLQSLAQDVRKVAALPAPIGQLLEEKTLPNNLLLQKVSVPLGVIGVIYEARPNVTVDVFALCFKSGNACILKGGKEAHFTNAFLVNLIKKVLSKHRLSAALVHLMAPEREDTLALLNAVGLVDVCIPRGSKALIDFVRNNSRIPVIETGAGIVHTYFDVTGDLVKGKAIIHNAKTRRVSVCNALDTLIVHAARLPHLPFLIESLLSKGVEIFADEASYSALQGHYPYALLHQAQDTDFGKEYLSHKMSIKTVSSCKDAIEHIMTYSSGHSEAIIAEDPKTVRLFLTGVDAAALYVNASTAFTDGGEFGMGAEIGISTQKLHARGPMGLQNLTSYKYILIGDGHIRP